MASSTSVSTALSSSILSPTTSATIPPAMPTKVADNVPAHNVNPIVAFIIGLAIILLASILNAAGLNLTKLDHVRTSAIPKASRRRDWLRPLWLLGMLLYILSQLIGSTLALEYMRAEYVAPLGSTSLIFNFLFAKFLVGTPVTSTDIYGTIIVILGVIGIVAFGSINSGLGAATDVTRITYLWRRPGWLGFFFAMSIALLLVLLFTIKLDGVLSARSEISSVPFAGMGGGAGSASQGSRKNKVPKNAFVKFFVGVKMYWGKLMVWVVELLEHWTMAKDDMTIAWTLGIGWACCGGGLAGLCLVFAKATVKLLSGSLSHTNPGNQFGHASAIFTIILLAATAVYQILCLNRGLKVYDSTLVVPVFYGVYTAAGFLDSLVFNDEVDAYQPWTLFLIIVSILILISGVVLLTHKKPEPGSAGPRSAAVQSASIALRNRRLAAAKQKQIAASTSKLEVAEDDEEVQTPAAGENEALWAVGEVSDGEEDEDEDIDHHQHPRNQASHSRAQQKELRAQRPGQEGVGLMTKENEDDADEPSSRT